MPPSLRRLIFFWFVFFFHFLLTLLSKTPIYSYPNHQARYHLTDKLNVWHNVTRPVKTVFWNRNTSMVYAVLFAALWAGSVWIYIFGENISFKHTLFFLETDIASILWMCKLQSLCAFEIHKQFCNLLLNIIILMLQPNKQVKTWRQTDRASQLNVKLCLLRWKYWPVDKFILSSNILSHCDAPHNSNAYPKSLIPVDGMAQDISHLHGAWGLKPLWWHPAKCRLGNLSWASFFPILRCKWKAVGNAAHHWIHSTIHPKAAPNRELCLGLCSRN